MSQSASIVLLLISTGLVALCAEFLVGSIEHLVENTPISEAFIGLIILPVVGNAAEHVTAVTVAAKNKLDLALGVALGSSIQIALFVTPFVVILGWILDKNMSLYFSLFETGSLFVATFIVNFLVSKYISILVPLNPACLLYGFSQAPSLFHLIDHIERHSTLIK